MNIPIHTKKINTYHKFQKGNDGYIFIFFKRKAVIFPQLPS